MAPSPSTSKQAALGDAGRQVSEACAQGCGGVTMSLCWQPGHFVLVSLQHPGDARAPVPRLGQGEPG